MVPERQKEIKRRQGIDHVQQFAEIDFRHCAKVMSTPRLQRMKDRNNH